jgi:hypothetical protein
VNPDLVGQKSDELRHQQMWLHLTVLPHVPVEKCIEPRHRTTKQPRKLRVRESHHARVVVQTTGQRESDERASVHASRSNEGTVE